MQASSQNLYQPPDLELWKLIFPTNLLLSGGVFFSQILVCVSDGLFSWGACCEAHILLSGAHERAGEPPLDHLCPSWAGRAPSVLLYYTLLYYVLYYTIIWHNVIWYTILSLWRRPRCVNSGCPTEGASRASPGTTWERTYYYYYYCICYNIYIYIYINYYYY